MGVCYQHSQYLNPAMRSLSPNRMRTTLGVPWTPEDPSPAFPPTSGVLFGVMLTSGPSLAAAAFLANLAMLMLGVGHPTQVDHRLHWCGCRGWGA